MKINTQEFYALNRNFDEADELRNAALQIESSAEFKIWLQIWDSRMSYLIFLENNRSAKLHFKNLNSVNLFISKDTDRWRKQRKLVKDIYNVINSGFSYQDHLISRNYHDNSNSKDTYTFFRYLRNFIVHKDTFPLLTKLENTSIFQAMNKSAFVSYLQSKLDNNIANDTQRDQRERPKLEKALEYTNNLPEVFNFEKIYDSYQEDVIGLHHRYIKKLVKAHLRELKKLYSKTTAHEISRSNYLQKYNISISDISRVLNSYQMRYLKILSKS
ncbi:hypothetical protein [Pedobacter xixiisoli]|uniref:Uncharacterized protein n=1 Tax=Pedobacter xixiisoli TaxID=1476464 RepID=A0A285ZZJ5_9SPHI|nr:hypothetical protein [Pedobacter xixiisoli]SOD15064.1 hypothetical protein SAMN06297358_2037 [Pedobacter xixiisoli]